MPSTRHQGEAETKHDSGLWEGSSQLDGKGKEQQPARPPPPAHLSVLLCVLWKSVKLLLCLSVSVFPTLTPILSLCVCGGGVCEHVYGGEVHLPVCVQMSKKSIPVLLHSFLPYSLETGLLTEPGARLVQPACPNHPVSAPYHNPQC